MYQNLQNPDCSNFHNILGDYSQFIDPLSSFMYVFYLKGLKNDKITVLGYKKPSKSKSDTGKKCATPKLWVVIYISFLSKLAEHTYSRGGKPLSFSPPFDLFVLIWRGLSRYVNFVIFIIFIVMSKIDWYAFKWKFFALIQIEV